MDCQEINDSAAQGFWAAQPFPFEAIRRENDLENRTVNGSKPRPVF